MSGSIAPATSSGGGSYGKSSGGGSSNPAPPVSTLSTGSAPATGAVGSPGKSVSNESPFNYGASPDSLAANAVGTPDGANFFTGVANNAPGGAYGATQQATDRMNSATQLQQMGGPLGSTGAQALQTGMAGLQSASGPQDLYNQYASTLFGQPAATVAPGVTPNPQPPATVADLTPQNLYNQYASTLFGQPANGYTPNFAGTQGGLSPEQTALMAAQTGLFNSNIGPATTPAPFNGVSTAPATVRPQPPAAPAPAPVVRAPAPVARPAPVVRAPAPVARPAPVAVKPSPFKPVLTRPGVQPALRTAPRPPSR